MERFIQNSIFLNRLATVDFFDINNPFDLTLTTDFNAFSENINEDHYLPATISYKLTDQGMVNKKIKVKARGVFRRENWPRWLNFYLTLRREGKYAE